MVMHVSSRDALANLMLVLTMPWRLAVLGLEHVKDNLGVRGAIYISKR